MSSTLEDVQRETDGAKKRVRLKSRKRKDSAGLVGHDMAIAETSFAANDRRADSEKTINSAKAAVNHAVAEDPEEAGFRPCHTEARPTVIEALASTSDWPIILGRA